MLAQTLNEAKKRILGQSVFLGNSTDPVREGQLSRFNTWFVPAYEAGLKAGKRPEQLLSSDSPDYLLKGDKLGEFAIKSPDDLLEGLRPGAKPGVHKKPLDEHLGGK